MIVCQGGDVSFVDEPAKLPESKFVYPIYAEKDGYIKTVDAKGVGESSVMIGAGRAKKGRSDQFGSWYHGAGQDWGIKSKKATVYLTFMLIKI